MTTILVTGGAGFIGSNFIQYMLKKYDDLIINLDALTYAANPDHLSDLVDNESYVFVHGDITDKACVEKIFRDYDITYVVNFAAESHVDRSIAGPEVFIQTNVMGTQVLLEAAKRAWTTGKDPKGYPTYKAGVKYLQISTDEVYGALGARGRFTENSPIAPNSPYAASKASADLLVASYHKTYKMPVNITRCANNYGPNQHNEKLIPLIIEKALTDQPLPVYGDGKQIRDWLHVKDHCRAVDQVLRKARSGQVYNIGGNQEVANIDIVKQLLKLLEKPESLITYVEDRLGHDRRYAIDARKLTKDLGWTPFIEFTEGLKETVFWYKGH